MLRGIILRCSINGFAGDLDRAFLINASTVLVKQHSFLDIIAGVVLSAVVYVISYRLLPVPELERIHR